MKINLEELLTRHDFADPVEGDPETLAALVAVVEAAQAFALDAHDGMYDDGWPVNSHDACVRVGARYIDTHLARLAEALTKFS